ncbi:hypothetical protein PIB30_096352 [Stylosanthes scabra]|uniref:Uncharacterized protein n=1 Tax=Stylosanthes scabra TaxID=79078 RepID=A0ABU6RWV6_9FABA|nr:hypothetical protein [Stylosanthes scabra]
MNSSSSRFCTCFFTSAAFSGLMRQSLWAIGLLSGNIDNLWLEKFGSIPDMLATVHATRSTFLLRKWVSPAFTSSNMFFAIIVTWSASSLICTLSSSSSVWLKVYEMELSSYVQFYGFGELLFGVMQCGTLAPFCLRDVPFEYSHFTTIGDELHEDKDRLRASLVFPPGDYYVFLLGMKIDFVVLSFPLVGDHLGGLILCEYLAFSHGGLA